ncbi:3-isopropylmalate dehydratase small subunit [Sulfitobacter geojensis]|uniref:3-isopropylmalate dehydratase small subunit n=1 Tax=Sulfitobacter geojensis TaxID=1342299 RepID=UPI000469FF7F|nr:3-isopropylmalate dehydratase small subunit [Sulfitobacter geojensis]KHA51338.1 3-isopropylmalate dehydratase small subunit [Sulfitobacter geojensis]NYI30255.1 3-isopropylmalate/(R)-2-methylmalate dehydratase small subunit [Sulfitobacter geojensis]
MNTPWIDHSGIVAPMMDDNINTDAIIPSREMKRVSKKGLADGLFANQRYLDTQRDPNPDFILNQAPFTKATILLFGANAGCGSSREHAVWALKDFGIRAVVAESFASIFQANCIANGILPIALPRDQVRAMAQWVEVDPAAHHVAIRLEQKTIGFDGREIPFEIADNPRRMLLNGVSPIDETLVFRKEIDGFFNQDRARRPWLYS